MKIGYYFVRCCAKYNLHKAWRDETLSKQLLLSSTTAMVPGPKSVLLLKWLDSLRGSVSVAFISFISKVFIILPQERLLHVCLPSCKIVKLDKRSSFDIGMKHQLYTSFALVCFQYNLSHSY